jgi:hypothetical protein
MQTIAILAIAGWAVAFITILLASRPQANHAPDTSGGRVVELPPAIVALLCARDGAVGEPAVTATFLDLIARSFLRRSVMVSGPVQIAPAGADDSALTPYERQVLEHVCARARIGGGAVLEEALGLESSDHDKRWMKLFSERVVADARERGLAKARVPYKVQLWLWLGLIGALVLLGMAWIGTFGAVIAFLLLSRIGVLLDGERPTEAGSRLVPAYRTLAAQVARERADASRPIDRRRAWAAALGAGAPARSPIAHQDRDRVWSNTSGQWREVRISDMPSVFQGTDPRAALWSIPGGLIFFGIWARLLYDFTAHPQRWGIPVILLAAGWVIYATLNFFVWRFVYRGIYDLNARTVHIEGQVIYLDVREDNGEHPSRTYHMAIDDGRSPKAVKHEIDPKLFETLRYGDWLRLEVTPKLRCVRSTEIVSSPSPA